MEGDARNIGASASLAVLVACDGKRGKTAAVERALEGDEFLFLRELLGQAHRAFVGFGSTVAKERLLESSRGHFGKFLRQVGDGRHVVDIGATVDEFVHLGLRSRDDFRVAVPSVDYGDAAIEIGVDLAILARDLAA